MGDRRNIIITEQMGMPGVAIYTHWSGSDAPELLADALNSPQARGRYGDEGYLTRIIFDQMSADDHLHETGWGIYPSIDGKSSPCEDSQGYDLIVETSSQTVGMLGKKRRSFAEFIDKYGTGA